MQTEDIRDVGLYTSTDIPFFFKEQSYRDELHVLIRMEGIAPLMDRTDFIVTPRESDLQRISEAINVDESVRKLALDACPPSASGVAIVNRKRGAMTILQRVIGGMSGNPGFIRTVEIFFTFPPEYELENELVRIMPLYLQTDADRDLRFVFAETRDFTAALQRMVGGMLDKAFNTFHDTYETVRQKMEDLVQREQTLEEDVSDEIALGYVAGNPIFLLQSTLEGVLRVLEGFEKNHT